MYVMYMDHISASPPKAKRDGNWPEPLCRRSASCINLRNTVVMPDSYTIFSDGSLAEESSDGGQPQVLFVGYNEN